MLYLIMIIIIGSINGCALFRPPIAPITGITISGHVIDDKGKPIPNCHVIYQFGNLTRSADFLITDEQGRFYGENLIGDHNLISFYHPDFSGTSVDKSYFIGKKDVEVKLSPFKEGIPAPLEKIDLNILVQNEDKMPVSDAEIRYRTQDDPQGKTVKTNAQGRVVLKGILCKKDNNVDIRVLHPDYMQCFHSVFQYIKDPNINITFVKLFVVSGKVIDKKTGKGIKEFDLRTSIKEIGSEGSVRGYYGGEIIKIKDGPDFKYEFSQYGNFEYDRMFEISARIPNSAWSRIQAVYDKNTTPSGKENLVIELDKGATLKGRVTDKQGRRITNAVCTSWDIYYDEMPVGSNGRFKFEHWPLFAKDLFFKAQGFKPENIRLDQIKEGQIIKLNVEMERFDESRIE